MPKRSLRAQLLEQRRQLSHDARFAANRDAQLNLLSLDEFGQAAVIALYAPIHNEIGTAMIMDSCFAANKVVLFPAVSGRHMSFRRVHSLDQLRKGAFGIPEPAPDAPVYGVERIDLMVVPGVGFDLSGHRIGYGKGYYDGFLQQREGEVPFLVGLCHDFQLTYGGVVPESHDIPMDVIVSETRIVRIQSFPPGATVSEPGK